MKKSLEEQIKEFKNFLDANNFRYGHCSLDNELHKFEFIIFPRNDETKSYRVIFEDQYHIKIIMVFDMNNYVTVNVSPLPGVYFTLEKTIAFFRLFL